MGRAVGGAGAGCAGAGLLGLLLSVAIVVWLGSQSLGGDGGSGIDADRTRPTDPAGLLAALDAPEVTVGDGEPLALDVPAPVRATGVAPGRATVAICALPEGWEPGQFVEPDRCAAPAAEAEVADDGELSLAITPTVPLTMGDEAVDCRTVACSVVLDPAGDGPLGAAPLLLAP